MMRSKKSQAHVHAPPSKGEVRRGLVHTWRIIRCGEEIK